MPKAPMDRFRGHLSRCSCSLRNSGVFGCWCNNQFAVVCEQVVNWYESAADRAYHTIMDALQRQKQGEDVADLLDARFLFEVTIDAEKVPTGVQCGRRFVRTSAVRVK